MKAISTAVASAILVVSLGCASQESYRAATQEVQNQDDVIVKLRDENNQLRAEYDELQNRHELAKLELDRLRAASTLVAEVGNLRDQLDNIKRRFAGIDGVEVRQRPDGTALSVKGSVLFKTGSDDVSDQGKTILRRVAEELNNVANQIRIEGHTDDIPVAVTIQKYPLGNLQLSGARSLNVAHFLIKDAGVSAGRVSFAGYGKERPVAANDADGGRAQNRRVEIVLLNE